MVDQRCKTKLQLKQGVLRMYKLFFIIKYLLQIVFQTTQPISCGFFDDFSVTTSKYSKTSI